MKLNKTLQKILKNSEWWFLERLDYLGASLIVEMVEGCVSSVSEDVTIDGAVIIPDARAVEVTEQSKRVRIEFSKVLAYQVIDESYYLSQSANKLEELKNTNCKFH